MPIYEYYCRRCAQYSEQITQRSDELVDKCPVCGSHEIDRVPSAPAVRFKGSGFYETEYKDKK